MYKSSDQEPSPPRAGRELEHIDLKLEHIEFKLEEIDTTLFPIDVDWSCLDSIKIDFSINQAETPITQTGSPSASPTKKRARKPAKGPSTPVNLRIPNDVLRTYEEEADKRHIGYQTLIVRALREQAAKW
jgi:uncharacterized protein (DUF4415 family)